ncbi:MAG TPA: hypothetical protein VM689_13065 [Aliidongia sp.]|nr:hypothetical protein [Aliidongia sp.]
MDWAALRLLFLLCLVLTPSAARAGDDDDDDDQGREFPKTLTIDEPGVDDETSLPTFSAIRQNGIASAPGFHRQDLAFELDKRLTERVDVQITDGYTRIDPTGAKSFEGWQNLEVALKGVAIRDAPHEFMLSGSIVREFGGSGAERVGADRFGATGPMLYFGKGMGDLDTQLLRPFAITGTLAYSFPDEPVSTGRGGIDHTPELISIGATIQYSLRYLRVEDDDGFIARLTPLVEFAMTTPATNGYGIGTQATVAPGILYSGDGFQLGLEALIPATRSAGSGLGAIAQLNIALRHLVPDWAAKPIF